MIIERSVGVRNVKTVVAAMKGGVEPLVHMHGAMEKVLPCVDDKDGNEILDSRDEVVVEK